MNLETAQYKIAYTKNKLISKSELAKAMGFCREYIGQLIKNKKELTENKIKKLEEYFEVDLSKEITIEFTPEEKELEEQANKLIQKLKQWELSESELDILADAFIEEKKKTMLALRAIMGDKKAWLKLKKLIED